jgi:hypothetical protein
LGQTVAGGGPRTTKQGGGPGGGGARPPHHLPGSVPASRRPAAGRSGGHADAIWTFCLPRPIHPDSGS